jgi:hypothetical protein
MRVRRGTAFGDESDADGHWITIDGNHILIGGGGGGGGASSAHQPGQATPTVRALNATHSVAQQEQALRAHLTQLGLTTEVSLKDGYAIKTDSGEPRQMVPSETVGTVKALADLAEQYPQAFERLSYIGGPRTASEYVTGAAAQTGHDDNANRVSMTLINGFTNDTISTAEKAQLAKAAKSDIDSMTMKDLKRMSAPVSETQSRAALEKSGYAPPHTAATEGATVVHEFGHVVQADIVWRQNAEPPHGPIQAAVSAYNAKFGFDETGHTSYKPTQDAIKSEPPSKYGAKNGQESFAETFLSYRAGNDTPRTRAMGELLTVVYKP